MSSRKPKWMNDEKPSTRAHSKKQETAVAKALRTGITTINSGATFGQNDVLTDFAEVECKTTEKASMTLTIETWEKLVKKSDKGKIPMMTLEFSKHETHLAVLPLDDLVFLLNMLEKKA